MSGIYYYFQNEVVAIILFLITIIALIRYIPRIISYSKATTDQLVILVKNMTVAVENNTTAMKENKDTLEANLKMQESTLKLLETQIEPIRLMADMVNNSGKQLDQLIVISNKLPSIELVNEMNTKFSTDHVRIIKELENIKMILNK